MTTTFRGVVVWRYEFYIVSAVFDDVVNGCWRGVMNTEELLRRYAAGERDFSGIDLRSDSYTGRPNLKNVDLRDIILRGADLLSVELSGANLSGANLFGASLIQAILIKADLRNAILTGANLTGAILSEADLRQANLEDTNLTRAILRETDLFQANLSRAILAHTLMGAKNVDVFQFDNVLLWETKLPGGKVVGPGYSR
jgi:uncharacterized protein YjbI with pentapeptide repeats